MKKLMITMVLLMTGINSFAASDESPELDFNQMIEESHQATRELHDKLKKEAGIETSLGAIGEIKKEDLPVYDQPEQVAVQTSEDKFFAAPLPGKYNEKANLKRLSQEIKDLQR
ncbi:MAG: hypothetical protein COT73_00595 [Bdellovibrio sp. CG10_big_fil_rev_8_21_14_0_10_47_8]|nr:MAG: hypothetical protein COT73_00595 [Bdellovibrio sp. CG10_big_fil_rev_8_21_14_0_10_47_8]